MKIHYFSSILVLFSFFFNTSYSYRQVNIQKQWYRYPGNPGIKIRLTRKGANYIKNIGVDFFNDYVSNLKDFSTTFPYSQIGFNGNVKISKLHIKNYHPPQLSVLNFSPPRFIILGLENIDLSLGSLFEAANPPFKFQGSLDGSITGMTIALTTELLADLQGNMNAIVRNCSAIIARSHITLNPTGPIGIFLKAFETAINESVRTRIPELLCSKLQELIEKNISKLFDKIVQINMEEYFPIENDKSNDFIKSFIKQFSKGMNLDNHMITQPLITMEYIETNHRGEINLKKENNYNIPFYPRPMENIDLMPDKMAHFFISDHVLNSMLFNAYQDNRLSIKINESSLSDEMRGFVDTTCPTKQNPTYICVGSLIPQIGKTFPNSTVSFIVLPHGLPYVMFDKESAAIEITNRILTYVNKNKNEKKSTQIIVFSLTGQADILFTPTKENLSSKLNLNRFNVRLHRSVLRNIDEASISRLSPLSKMFISSRLNAVIDRLFRYPEKSLIKMKNQMITYQNNFIVLSSDFQFNDNEFKKVLKKSLDL